MTTLRDIRKRIASVRGTQQITKAMKMVAAAKLRKAQEAILAARPYSDAVSRLFRHLVRHAAGSENPLVRARAGSRTLLLVVTSDRGLCGGFNGNVLRAVEKYARGEGAGLQALEFALVGKKAADYFRRRPQHRVLKSYAQLLPAFDYGKAAALADELVQRYLDNEVDRITLVYNRFISALRQQVVFQPLLPVADEEPPELVDYLYEPGRQVIWDAVIPKYLNFEVFRCVLDSLAGEHGARMTGMDGATKNAGEMIERLTLQMNRARQAMITRELMEIISGKEAQGA